MESDRVLTTQLLKHSFLIVFPKVGNEFRVAMRREAMTLGFEQGFLLAIIEEFAVEHRRDRPVFIENRLTAVEETDNTKTPRTEG